jgi:hypothetical protein
MAIRVTDNLGTDQGNTTTLYFNIDTFSLANKDGSTCIVSVNFYTNKDKATPVNEVYNVNLNKTYVLDLSATLNSNNWKKVAYDKLGADLLAAGLSPESDETGSWVAYT